MKAPLAHSKPLYQRLVEDISSRIDDGAWAVGAKLPSERALCEMYEVSQITVRRALRELTQAGYVYSHHGLGWFVGDRGASAGSARDVALIVSELDALAVQLAPHLVDALRPQHALRLVFQDGDAASCAETVDRAITAGAEAAIVAVSGEERRLKECYGPVVAGAQAPVILLWREVAGVDAPAVVLDEVGAMQAITEHLLRLGHQRVAYVGDVPTLVGGQRRYRGFFSALLERGHELPMEWVFSGQLSERANSERFARVFGDAGRPTAVVCGSDERAAEALALLAHYDLACPEEVAVVGLGDAPFAALLGTPLTSYRFDMRRAAGAIAGQLRSLLAGQRADDVLVTGGVVQRASCGAHILV